MNKGRSNKVLVLQAMILLGCVAAVVLWLKDFPYPSVLTRQLLPPKERWPTEQVAAWVRSGEVRGDFLKFFYRDPEREIPAQGRIVAPADGVVKRMKTIEGTTYVVIALSFWDVHVQRSPAEGVVVDIERSGDVFVNEDRIQEFIRKKNSPVQKIVTMQSKWGIIKIRLITSVFARRIEIWLNDEDRVEKGQRLGRILLGSTVVVELPSKLRLAVKEGQRVLAGETIIVE